MHIYSLNMLFLLMIELLNRPTWESLDSSVGRSVLFLETWSSPMTRRYRELWPWVQSLDSAEGQHRCRCGTTDPVPNAFQPSWAVGDESGKLAHFDTGIQASSGAQEVTNIIYHAEMLM